MLCKPFACRQFHYCMWKCLQSKTFAKQNTGHNIGLSFSSVKLCFARVIWLDLQISENCCCRQAESTPALQSYFILPYWSVTCSLQTHITNLCFFFVCFSSKTLIVPFVFVTLFCACELWNCLLKFRFQIKNDIYFSELFTYFTLYVMLNCYYLICKCRLEFLIFDKSINMYKLVVYCNLKSCEWNLS